MALRFSVRLSFSSGEERDGKFGQEIYGTVCHLSKEGIAGGPTNGKNASAKTHWGRNDEFTNGRFGGSSIAALRFRVVDGHADIDQSKAPVFPD